VRAARRLLSARLAIVLGALVGLVIAWHQPRHPMGWVLPGVAGFFSLLGVASGYLTLDYGRHHGTWPPRSRRRQALEPASVSVWLTPRT
jgi:hypothetical protein